MIAVCARADYSRAALVHKDQGPQLLCCLPEGQEVWRVEGLAVDGVIDHGAFEAELGDAPLQFGNRRPQVLHGQSAETRKAVRVVSGHLTYFVVRLSACGAGLVV